jgi:hypothetical protein
VLQKKLEAKESENSRLQEEKKALENLAIERIETNNQIKIMESSMAKMQEEIIKSKNE